MVELAMLTTLVVVAWELGRIVVGLERVRAELCTARWEQGRMSRLKAQGGREGT
jgi:hypothetical protein